MLANYAARKGDSNPLEAQVGVCCHFDSKAAFGYLSTHLFGFFDYFLGICAILNNKTNFEVYDKLIAKT